MDFFLGLVFGTIKHITSMNDENFSTSLTTILFWLSFFHLLPQSGPSHQNEVLLGSPILWFFFYCSGNKIISHLKHIVEVYNMYHISVEGYSSCVDMVFSAYEYFNCGLSAIKHKGHDLILLNSPLYAVRMKKRMLLALSWVWHDYKWFTVKFWKRECAFLCLPTNLCGSIYLFSLLKSKIVLY